jgi:hypothetical protein
MGLDNPAVRQILLYITLIFHKTQADGEMRPLNNLSKLYNEKTAMVEF